jgi:hypothetical protein
MPVVGYLSHEHMLQGRVKFMVNEYKHITVNMFDKKLGKDKFFVKLNTEII